jgi:excisionase family DNA binding protein
LVDWSDFPPILDAAQVAEMLGLNVQMVRRYAREGRLPAYKLPGGRTFYFLRDELIEFLRQHPVVPKGEVADEPEKQPTRKPRGVKKARSARRS